MDIEKYDNKIKAIYNDCWKSFRQYTGDHDMAAYNGRSIGLMEQHKSSFCQNILLSFAPVVNTMHEEYMKRGEKWWMI